MIITHILRNADDIHMCSAEGVSIGLSPAEWLAFLQTRGAVSLPFDIDQNDGEHTGPDFPMRRMTSDHTNSVRAGIAKDALEYYTRVGGGNIDTAVADLLTDIMHHCMTVDFKPGIDVTFFDQEMRAATGNFDRECKGTEE
jgi:hypothetical protein